MNTLQISCFMEAAKCRSFSKAAKNLYISQPSLSRNISQLEQETGLILFRRNSFHGIDLTESGRIMMEAFSAAQSEIISAMEKAKSIEQEKSLNMTLGLLEGQLLDSRLSELLADFRHEYPNVSVDIRRDTYRKLMAALISDEVSLVCMPDWQFKDRSQLVLTPFSNMETVLVIPRRLFPHPEDRVYSLREFQNLSIISIDEEESRTPQDMLAELCRSLEITPVLKKAKSLKEQIHMVEMGEGAILINPDNYICYSPNVTCVKVSELLPQPFSVAWKKTDAPASISLFQSFLNSRTRPR